MDKNNEILRKIKYKKDDTSGIRTHARRLVPKTSALDRSAIVSYTSIITLCSYYLIQTNSESHIETTFTYQYIIPIYTSY